MWEAPLLRRRMSVFLWGSSAHWFITAWCVKGSFLFSLFNKGRVLNLLNVCTHPSVYWVQLSFFQSILLCYFITSAFLLWIVVVLMHNLEPSLCYPIRPMVNMMLPPPSTFFYFSVIMLVLFDLLLLLERCYLTYYVAKLYWCVGRHVGLSARLWLSPLHLLWSNKFQALNW